MVPRTFLVSTLLVALLLATLPVPVSADPPGYPGPFLGAVAEGEVAHHVFSNDVVNGDCIQVQQPYTVLLRHGVPADVLELSVGDATVASAAGAASLTVWRTPCTTFLIDVRGAEVDLLAPYAVAVLPGAADPLGPAPGPTSTVVPIGHPGPFVGLAVEDVTTTHRYATDVFGSPCIPMVALFTVTLKHGGDDVLSLEAGGESATSVDGSARVSFYRSWCTEFDVDVTGIEVASVAPYVVTVARVGGA